MEDKIVEFGNYLLTLNIDKEKEVFILGSVINHPKKNLFIKRKYIYKNLNKMY